MYLYNYCANLLNFCVIVTLFVKKLCSKSSFWGNYVIFYGVYCLVCDKVSVLVSCVIVNK